MPAPVTTLAAIRLEAARQAGLGFSGTCSGNGTTTTLLDLLLTDSAVDSAFGEGGFLYRPSAAAAQRLRRVSADGFNTSTGAFTVNRAWGSGAEPASAEAYEFYALLPPVDHPAIPYSWDRAINDGLAHCYHEDELVLGRGRANGDRRFRVDTAEHVLIAVVAVAGGTGATITPPTGWTLIRRTNQGTDVALATYWRRARLDDALEWQWTFDTSRAAAGGIVAYADVNVSDPVDVDAGNSGASAVTATAPAATTTVADTRILRAYAGSGATVFTRPTDHAERFDVESERPGASIAAMAADEEQVSTGSSGAANATLGVARAWAAQTIALQPLDADAREIAYVTATSAQNGSGATTLDIPRPSTIPNDDWRPSRHSIVGVVTRTFDSNAHPHDLDWSREGRWWEPRQDEGELYVELGPGGPTPRSVVIAKVVRPYPSLAADADETTCPLRLAARAAIWQAFRKMNETPGTVGQYVVEEANALADWLREYEPLRPRDAIVV